jgi:RNA polymerase sigma-70 factor (ECF subfamily)
MVSKGPTVIEPFEDVLRRESPRVYGLCYRLTGNATDAEDLSQESWARAFKYYARFEGRSQVSTWLYRLVVNVWKNKLRAKKNMFFFGLFRKTADDVDAFEAVEFEGNEPAPGADIERSESERMLQEALMTLDLEAREIVVLRDLEEKSYEDIAVILDVPVGTVKSRLARARETLRRRLVPLLRAKGEIE